MDRDADGSGRWTEAQPSLWARDVLTALGDGGQDGPAAKCYGTVSVGSGLWNLPLTRPSAAPDSP